MKFFHEQSSLFSDVGSLKDPVTRREELLKAWSPPSYLMVKLNVDGASCGNPRSADCGCVIRDHHGNWLIGAAQNLGICTAYQAEI